MDAFDADVLIYAAAPRHPLGRRVRLLFPDDAAPAGGAAGADALFEAVRRGLKNEARAAAGEALKTREPLQVVNETLIPALDVVGDAFEKGSIFLPQLLQSATATQAAFEVIKTAIAASGSAASTAKRIWPRWRCSPAWVACSMAFRLLVGKARFTAQFTTLTAWRISLPQS